MSKSYLHFTISERKLYLRFFDSVLAIITLFFTSYLLDFEYFNFYSADSATWVALLVFYLLFFGEIFELYNLKVASDKYLTLRSVLITTIFTVIFYVFTPMVSPELPKNRFQIVYFTFALIIPILINRFVYIQFIFSPRFLKNILMIAEVGQIKNVISEVEYSGSNKIVAYISNDSLENNSKLNYIKSEQVNLEKTVRENHINEIIVCSRKFDFDDEIKNQLIELFENGMIIRSVDSFIEEVTHRISEEQLTPNFYDYFALSKSHKNNLYLTFRRIYDLFFSFIGIFIFLILVPIIFIANLFANKGKLLFFQNRVGKRGQVFKIIKFRTMVSNAEKNGAVWATKNDSRITPFGRLLRKTRIDEFPQFFNVLRGEMSLIGPRPERPEFVEQLEKELPFYTLRHVIKPGLTGWAQVKHPYAHTVKDQHKKLLYDLYYIKEQNLLLDFKIVMKTISTIIFFRGT